MSNILYDLNDQSTSINKDFDLAIKSLHKTKRKAELDKKTFDKAKETLSNAKVSQKKAVNANEDDKKHFKLMRRYGDVLHLVEKLLGLIPSNLSNMSTEELEEKLKELLNSRKNNKQQMMFMFYQNLISDLLTNLISIETKYLNKEISSSQAREYVQESKKQIKEYSKQSPESLKPTLKDASDLVRLYENNYNAENNANFGLPGPNLISTELNQRHRETFEHLNKKTTSMISEIGSLSKDISQFEPQVDLSSIITQIGQTESLISKEDWDLKAVESSISTLETTTSGLIDKQVDKNHQKEKIEGNIKSLTDDSKDLSLTSVTDISKASAQDISVRITQTINNTNQISEQLKENDDSIFWLAMIPIFMGTLDSQMFAYETIQPNLAPYCGNELMMQNSAMINQVLGTTQNINASVETLLLNQGAIKTLQIPDKKE